MNLIVPMAGRGTRLRPHTLTTPKPLVPVAGIPIIERLVGDLARGQERPFGEIAYIIRDLEEDARSHLENIAGNLGAKARFYVQSEPLGPAHAIYCAADSLQGPCMIAFADTLFKADFDFSLQNDGVIWVKKVEDPTAYGVVTLDGNGVIDAFVEKPDTFVSDLAIVGIYYLRQGEKLRDEIERMIENEIREKGEYQITTALDNLRKAGMQFKTAEIAEWLDCGNKEALIHANQRILHWKGENKIAKNARIENSLIIEPCVIGENSRITNSVVGPFVTIGDRVEMERVLIENSIVQNDSRISGVNIEKSLIGHHVDCAGSPSELDLGDYSNFNS